MKVITILNDKRSVLEGKIKALEGEMLKLDGIATSENMTSIAQRMQEIESELKVAKMALANLDREIKEKASWLNSKEYKEMLARQDEIKAENLKKTKEVFKEVKRLNEIALSIIETNKEYDRLARKTGTFQGVAINQKQPYGWLGLVHRNTSGLLNDSSWLKEKLE